MAYTEVTTQSWFSRIGGAIKGVLIGMILLVVAFGLLFWNEGRAIKRHRTLTQGASQFVSISADSVDPGNNGKLVHVSGRAETEAILSDPVFSVSVNAIQLKRDVEMYQWKENVSSQTKTKVGGKTETTKTYTYEKVWSDDVIKSGSFKEQAGHENPGAMPYSADTKYADTVTLGAFRLSSSQVRSIGNANELNLPSDTAIPEALTDKAILQSSGFYIGQDPTAPQIGDVRITFHAVYPQDISIVAQQSGNSFGAFPMKQGSIDLLESGIVSGEQMFQSAISSNRMMAWLLRLAGFILFLIGFNMIFRPFSVVADVLPIMGKIVGAGTGMIAFLLAAIMSLFAISIGWVTYRPLIGVPLLIAAVALVVLVIKKIKDAKSKTPAPAAAA